MEAAPVCDDLWSLLYILLIQQVAVLIASIEYHNSVCEHNNLLHSTITMATSLFQCWFRLLSFNDRSYKACLPNDVEYFVYPHTLLRTCLNYARCLGRKPSLLPHAELGLFLFFIGSANNIKHLCLIFGATPSVCSRSLWKLLNQIPGIEIILLQGSNFDLKQKCNSWQHWFNHMSLLLMT